MDLAVRARGPLSAPKCPVRIPVFGPWRRASCTFSLQENQRAAWKVFSLDNDAEFVSSPNERQLEASTSGREADAVHFGSHSLKDLLDELQRATIMHEHSENAVLTGTLICQELVIRRVTTTHLPMARYDSSGYRTPVVNVSICHSIFRFFCARLRDSGSSAGIPPSEIVRALRSLVDTHWSFAGPFYREAEAVMRQEVGLGARPQSSILGHIPSFRCTL